MKRIFLIMLVLGSMLVFGCIGGGTACESNEDCADYERCNLETGTCEVAPGYCKSDADCTDELTKCDTKTRQCVFKEGRCLC